MKRNTYSVLAVLAVLTLTMPGCNVVDEATGVDKANLGQSMEQPSGTMTRKELAQKLRRLAMSYLGEVPDACEQIASRDLPLDKRLLAMTIRVNSADSVISIAADPDPQVSLLNMVTVLTLQRMLAEQRAEEFFGEHGTLYVNAARRMEDEAWKLAAQVMDEKERENLRELIAKYRSDHPEDVYVWWVRFSEFSSYKENFSIAAVGQGVVDLFVPAGAAVAGTENTTDVAERATWLAARQALIVQWRVELTYLQTLAAPETARLLDDIERVSNTIDALPSHIANERKEILKVLNDQEGALNQMVVKTRDVVREVKATTQEANQVVENVDATLKTAGQTTEQVKQAIVQAETSVLNAKKILPETESTLAQLDQTSQTINQTIKTLDTFMRQFESGDSEGGPEPRPFDIREYTQTVVEAGQTIEQLNTLVNNVDQAAEPTRLDRSVAVVTDQFRSLIWQAGAVVVLAGLVLIVAAKLIPQHRERHASSSDA